MLHNDTSLFEEMVFWGSADQQCHWDLWEEAKTSMAHIPIGKSNRCCFIGMCNITCISFDVIVSNNKGYYCDIGINIKDETFKKNITS